MLNKYKVAGCVVFYHPNNEVFSNIASYISSIEHLIVVNNTEVPDPIFKEDLYKLFPNVIYIFLNKNAGIAAALNIACKIAIQHECNWLLTMDQDSNFKNDQFSQFLAGIPLVTSQYQKVGIISPHHVLHAQHIPKTTRQYTVKNIAMTSGNLLNLIAFEEIGPFDEKLFMDYVDYEYCLRLRKNNYKIIQDNFIHLKHSLGKYNIKKILGKNVGVSNHNALRRYYMTRNSLYVAFKYFRHDRNFFIYTLWNNFFWNFFIILSFEKNKAAKLRAVYKGISHFLIDKYGKAV